MYEGMKTGSQVATIDMDDTAGRAGYRDRSLILKIVGAVVLLVGISAAFLGPLELYCFYLFSEDGPFHYEGFGVGAFMFANIASQILGYYLIAAICIPLGYGHLKLRRWVWSLSPTLLWFWLVMGLPLMIVAYGMFIQAKEPSPALLVGTLPFAAILYPIAPILLLRFYRSREVRHTFESRDAQPYWLENIPLPVRGLCLLFCFHMVVLHVVILLNGVFPMFGMLLNGLWGIFAIDVAIMALAVLTWGLARLEPWAWWGSLIAFGLMTLSSLVTFSRASVGDILLKMNFPDFEMELFQNIPFLDFHPTAFAVIPLLAMMAIIWAVGGHFRANHEPQGART
jgi:hypothetical protein